MNNSVTEHTNLAVAGTVMQGRVINLDAAITHAGVNPYVRILSSLTSVPYSLDILRKYAARETYSLIGKPALSLLDLTSRFEGLFHPSNSVGKLTRLFPFANRVGGAEWCLVQTTPLETSLGKSWIDQCAELEENEFVPSATLVVYTCIMHFLIRGERLFQDVLVRCADTSGFGFHVEVGFFTQEGLVISISANERSDESLGIANAVRSNQYQQTTGQVLPFIIGARKSA